MLGNYKRGFTLLEIMVVLAIIGILFGLMVPAIRRFGPGRQSQEFAVGLTNFVNTAWQRAVSQRKIYKINVDIEHKKITMQVATGIIKDGNPEFIPAKQARSLSIPQSIEFVNFFIEGFDELKRGVGRETKETWFYIMPDGATQTVTINFIDKKNKRSDGKPKQFGMVLNPFNGQFTIYDSFKK